MNQLPKPQVQPCDGGTVKFPSENDVLSGRGGRINNHTGNVRFRKLVAAEKLKYLSIHKKMDKAMIAVDIVEKIRILEPPGRFLKQDPDSLCWYEIGDERARKKTGQALREDGPDLRKEMDQEENMHNYGNQNTLFPVMPPPIGNIIYPTPSYPFIPYNTGQPLLYLPMMYPPPQYNSRGYRPTMPVPNSSTPQINTAQSNSNNSILLIGNQYQEIPSMAQYNTMPQEIIEQSKMTAIPTSSSSTSMIIEPIPLHEQKRKKSLKLLRNTARKSSNDNDKKKSSGNNSSTSTSDDRQKNVEIDELIFETFFNGG